MDPVMHISLHRIQCDEHQAEAVAVEYGEKLRRGGLLVARVRVVWKSGTAVIAIHSRGRKATKRVAPALARKLQQAQTPALFDVFSAA